MADNDTDRKGSDADNAGILKEARARWDRAYERERSNIEAAYEDLEFLAGAQWPDKVVRERISEDRPILTINRLPQFVHQVTGDIRQMKPSIKVVPVDDQADPKVADLKGGMVRYIENRSDASGIYFGAADQQVAAGISHWRVLTEYASDSTFEQELRIASVDDGISVLWDPDARLPTREDAKFCFVPVDYSQDGFKEAFPDASVSDFSDLATWSNYSQWYTDSHVRVAEYWVKKPVKKTLALTTDGKTIDLSEDDEDYTSEEKIALAKAHGDKIEVRDSYKVCRYLMTAGEILEGPEEWMGMYIPIVPVIGEETKIGRKVIRNGIVRHAKDPQRMYNYGRATQTEVFSLQPKAPFMVTELNVAKYQDLWNTANRKNWPYLPYEPDQKNGGIAPQRIAPPIASQGVNEAVALANEDMKGVIGIYDASLGNKSNETSGIAIKARQREGDTGTYVYIDNFGRAVRHTGKILVDLIPHVYDTQRTIRIMGDDGRIDVMHINQERDATGMPILDEQGQPKIVNDVTVGSYDVVAEVGPSYTTRREEAKDGMLSFLQAAPDTGPLILDLVAKAQDWPMADDIAKRIRTTLPPKILQMEDMEKQGASPEQIQQALRQVQPPPDPQVALEQQKLQLEQQSRQADMEMKVQESKAKMAADQQAQQQKLEFEAQKHAQEMQFEREKHQNEMAMRDREMQTNAMLEARKQDGDHAAKREQIAASSKPSAEIKLDANEAVKGMAPAFEQAIAKNEATMAQAAQVMAEAAQIIAQAVKVMAAPRKTTIVRDHNNRATHSVSEPLTMQ